MGTGNVKIGWYWDYGTDYPAFADTVSSNLAGYGNYLLYATSARSSVDGDAPAFGEGKQSDSARHAGSREERRLLIERLEASYGDSTLTWLTGQYETHASAINAPDKWDFLVVRDTILGAAAPTTARGYPAAKKFDNGAVFMRGGWDLATTSTDIWAVYRHEQYPFHHAHADAGHFCVFRGNDLMLIEK